MMHKIFTFFFVLSVFCFRAQNYMVSTIAGNGTIGMQDGNGISAATLYHPYELVSDGGNLIYFCDTYNHTIRKYNKTSGLVTTIAGTGTAGYQDGPCATALFNYPEGIVVYNNALYIGGNYDHCIRKIDLGTNIVSTVAGSGTPGHQDGAAGTAMFNNPKFITLAKNGDLYISDYVNECIRKLSNGQVTTVAGTPGVQGYANGPGSTAQFHGIADLCMDTLGNIFCTDAYNNVIRKIDASYNVTTYAGTGASGHVDGPPGTAQIMFPCALDVTENGSIYFTGGAGGDQTIRKIDPSGNVSTVAGTFGAQGFQDGLASAAKFYWPYGVTYDKNCAIYICDSWNNRIRKITVPEGPAGCVLNEIAETENSNLAVKLFPVPAITSVVVEIPYLEVEHSYHILNSLGAVVAQGVLQQMATTIDLSYLAEGIYYLKVSEGKKNVTRKLIVQK